MLQHDRALRTTRTTLFAYCFWVFLLNLVICIAISSRYRSVFPISGQPLAQTFYLLMTLGHLALIVCITIFPVAIIAALITRLRPVSILSLFSATLLVLYLILDSIVFQLYRFHVGGGVLELLFGGAAQEIFVFPRSTYIKAAAFVLFVVGVQSLLSALAWRLASSGRTRKVAVLAAITLLLATLLQNGLYAWADATGYTPITQQAGLYPGYFPATAKRFLKRFGFSIADRPSERNLEPTETALAYPLSPLRCTSAPVKPNIVMLVIDSWVFHALTQEITPNIAAFAEKHLRFMDHLSGGSATRSGIFTLLYGVPATYWHAFLAEERGPVLMQELLRRNYQFGIFANAPLTSPEFHRTVFANVPNLRLTSQAPDVIGRDREITREFLSFLDARDRSRPFFGFLFFDAPHAMAVPPDEPLPFTPSLAEIDYLALNNDYDRQPFFNRYLNSVHFVDELVGQILKRFAEEEKLMENTVIVITADHGQEFNENRLNYWGHNGNFSRYQTGVPLVVAWPGRSAEEFHHRTSHFDIAPTVLSELLQCENNAKDYSVGTSLFQPGNRDTLLLANYGQYAIVGKDRITIFQPYGGVEEVDPGYRPLPHAPTSREALLSAVEQRSRFYRR